MAATDAATGRVVSHAPLVHSAPHGKGESTSGMLRDLPDIDRKDGHDGGRDDPKKQKKKKKANSEVPPDMPKEFLCEITRRPMNDPVKSIYGNTFERATITTWFKNQGRICPLSGTPPQQGCIQLTFP